MDLKKFSHACVRIESGGRALVIDPGNFGSVAAALAGVEAVLVTHEYADHLDLEPVLEVLKSRTEISLHAPDPVAARVLEAAVAAGVPNARERIHAVAAGDSFTLAGLKVTAYGGDHALIHQTLPRVANLGYLIEGRLFHPGDSYSVPEGIGVKTLLIPAHAPWAKIGETIDFLVAVGAARNFPIHDGLLNARGLAMMDGHLTRVANERGLSYQRIADGESVSLDG